MNKKEFLKELEKKLKILNDEERKDIIDEHRDVIEEKIKNGKSEEEAIADFGDVNDLAKEILKAYKLNPEYSKTSETFDDAKESFDDFVTRSANWLSEKAKNLFQSVEEEEITIEKIFEIIIKVFVVLIVLYIAKIPFTIFSSMGASIFESSIFPFILLKYVWIVLIELLYIVLVLAVIFIVFRDYFFKRREEVENYQKPKKKAEKVTKSKTKKVASQKNNEITEKSVSSNNDGAIIVLKVLVFIFLAFPLIMATFGLMMLLSLLVFFIIKGLILWGPLLLVVGFLSFNIFVLHLIAAIFNNQKTSGWPFLTIFVLILLGLLLTFDWAVNLTIKEGEPGTLTSEAFVLDIEDYETRTFWHDFEFLIDPELEDDQIIVEIHYNDKYENLINVDPKGRANISITSFRNLRELGEIFVEGLKEDELYVPYYEVKVFGNEKTIEKLENS